jgi:hypothetical protein
MQARRRLTSSPVRTVALPSRGALNRSSPCERLSRPKVRRGFDEAFELFAAPSRGCLRGAEAGSTHVSRYKAHVSTHHPRPPRRPDFGRSASVAYEFVHFGLGNREPETFRRARSLDARRDNPARPPRRLARHPAAPLHWPTLRDLGARNPLSQKRVRTPQNANAPAVWPGHSL